MGKDQKSLFDTRAYRGEKRQSFDIKPPAADQSVFASLPAYHAHLSSGGYSKYTPDDFTSDIKRFGQFVGDKPIGEIMDVDIRQWISKLKGTMEPKTVSRKVSAIGNYFRWLTSSKVLDENPAIGIHAPRVRAPLPDILYENECQELLKTASKDPMDYLLVLLLLETGIKKAELQALKVGDFDFSNKYQPELWVRHSGRHVFKDRRLKLPPEIISVFKDYTEQYKVTDLLFPFTPKTLERSLAKSGKDAGISKPITASLLRDMFVIRSIKSGAIMEEVFGKIGLSKESYDDARKKYGRLTSNPL